MFRVGVDMTGGLAWFLINSTVNGNHNDTSSFAVKITGASFTLIDGCVIQRGGSSSAVVSVASAGNIINGTYIDGSATGGPSNCDGLLITTNGGVFLTGSSAVLGASGKHGVSVASGAAHFNSDRVTGISPDILDSRTGAPVNYSFSANGSVTPLTMNNESIRLIATTGGITVTVNAISANGFGRMWSLELVNNSGGAVTWSFNAQYKLAGGAAPAPATGNSIVLLLQYDPVGGTVREISRSGSVPI